MARIRIVAPAGRKFVSFTPVELPHLTVRYKADHDYTVKESWATQLEFLGQAVRVRVPPRPPAVEAAAVAGEGKPLARTAKVRGPSRPRARRARPQA